MQITGMVIITITIMAVIIITMVVTTTIDGTSRNVDIITIITDTIGDTVAATTTLLAL